MVQFEEVKDSCPVVASSSPLESSIVGAACTESATKRRVRERSLSSWQCSSM